MSEDAKITPYLWFDDRLEEAIEFYAGIFPDARVIEVARYPEDAPGGSGGKLMNATFELAGQRFIGLNGGPQHRFSEAISFLVSCDDAEEVDHYWDALTADGGEESMCGWLKDKYGLSWQIVPTALSRYLSDPEPARAERVMQAMLRMRKIDVAELERAYAREETAEAGPTPAAAAAEPAEAGEPAGEPAEPAADEEAADAREESVPEPGEHVGASAGRGYGDSRPE